MAHVFISYHKNSSRQYARQLADHLIANGFDVWIDDRINLGSEWEREIFRAIDSCGAFIIIMTPGSYDSKWVQREYHYADRRNKKQFPLLLDGETFPFYSNVQYVDVHTGQLPPDSFFSELEACGVQRKSTSGRDIVTLPLPIPETTSLPLIETNVVQRRQIARMLPFAVTGIVTLLVVITLIALSANNGGQTGTFQTETQAALFLTTPQPTDTPSSTSTLRPTQTLSLTPNASSIVAASSTLNSAQNVTETALATESRIQLPENCIYYVIQEGDSPYRIAEQFGISRFDLFAANGLDEESAPLLQIGQQLIIPLPGCPLLNSPLPTTVNAQVEIISILGAGDISAEAIVLRNNGAVIDLTGWTLSDGGAHVYTFPQLRLFSNAQITLYTLPGLDTPVTLFWGRTQAIWQTGDIVTLSDADGNIQSSVRVP